MVHETVFTREMLPENVKQNLSSMKLYLGGDVSKGYADWVILSEKKQAVLDNFQHRYHQAESCIKQLVSSRKGLPSRHILY